MGETLEYIEETIGDDYEEALNEAQEELENCLNEIIELLNSFDENNYTFKIFGSKFKELIKTRDTYLYLNNISVENYYFDNIQKYS